VFPEYLEAVLPCTNVPHLFDDIRKQRDDRVGNSTKNFINICMSGMILRRTTHAVSYPEWTYSWEGGRGIESVFLRVITYFTIMCAIANTSLVVR
jgi:hypothetical protein